MKKLTAFLVLLFFWSTATAQTKPAFWNEIQQFKKADAEKLPESNGVLLIGSSSFTMWKDIANYFPGTTFINRGFGGSSLYDLNFYSAELLQPYNPKQILIYCGENDFAGDENLKPRDVLNRFKHFYSDIRKYHPNVPVAYISIKMSPSRKHLWPKFTATNSLIRNFMRRNQNAEYIDITKAMAGKDGQPRNELFLEDQLHMTPEGYKIWAAKMAPHIK
ncbi:hypothetical protein FIC_00560 [Flavobacteriaceae bacterium 3519-10]|nr:hypothetical protein FIC_00560 [Flavobacteriaceae bacterium 3519-10]